MLCTAQYEKSFPKWATIYYISPTSYESYEAYIAHQQQKLRRYGKFYTDTSGKKKTVVQLLRKWNHDHAINFAGARVLCLGARFGGEVEAFRTFNASVAIGLDLNPGPGNANVLYGDFHRMKFPSRAFDFVYTDVLDHAFDLRALGAEICRVLAPGGELLVTTHEERRGENNTKPSRYEALEVGAILFPRLAKEMGMAAGPHTLTDLGSIALACPSPPLPPLTTTTATVEAPSAATAAGFGDRGALDGLFGLVIGPAPDEQAIKALVAAGALTIGIDTHRPPAPPSSSNATAGRRDRRRPGGGRRAHRAQRSGPCRSARLRCSSATPRRTSSSKERPPSRSTGPR